MAADGTTRLRHLAATGPVLDGRTVMIDQDGPVLLDHPLTPEC
jgi:hypothetical protein